VLFSLSKAELEKLVLFFFGGQQLQRSHSHSHSLAVAMKSGFAIVVIGYYSHYKPRKQAADHLERRLAALGENCRVFN